MTRVTAHRVPFSFRMRRDDPSFNIPQETPMTLPIYNNIIGLSLTLGSGLALGHFLWTPADGLAVAVLGLTALRLVVNILGWGK